jgi:hypothetical protein
VVRPTTRSAPTLRPPAVPEQLRAEHATEAEQVGLARLVSGSRNRRSVRTPRGPSLAVVTPELVEENAQSVLADVYRTTSLRPEVLAADLDGALVVSYNGNSTSGDLDAEVNPAALVQLADYLQEFVAEDVGTAGQATLWPVCPTHSRRLRAETDGDRGVWKCPWGHVASRIGELPAEYGPDPRA